MSAALTLVGTPDRDPITPMPSPATCSCIFAGRTSGPFGINMSIEKVGDPHCPRHRAAERPSKAKLSGPRIIGAWVDEAASMFSPRRKLA